MLLTPVAATAPTHIAATPANIASVLVSAKCGNEIDLGTGDYPSIRIYGLKPSCPIIIDGSAAAIQNITFSASSNWIIQGASFSPYIGPQVQVSESDHIIIRDSTSTGASIDFVLVANSSYVELANNRVQGSLADGFDVAGDSHFINIHDNRCVGATPSPTAHPDCVQAWSVAGSPPVSDMWITNNVAVGPTMGFDGFDHGTGGFARIHLTGNVVGSTAVWAGEWNACQACTMTGNIAYTMVGQPKGWGGTKWFMTDGPTDGSPDSGKTVQSGNINGAPP